MKSPDAIDYALENIEDPDEKEEIRDKLSEHFRYGEYLDLEYNTETDELKIVKPR
jgi:hypothetical protein